MIIPDVNLLLYANLAAFEVHASARRWWETALNGDEPVGLPAVSIFGFIRISTNPRVFQPAMAVTEAIGRVEKWLGQPHVGLLSSGPRHLQLAFPLLAALGAATEL